MSKAFVNTIRRDEQDGADLSTAIIVLEQNSLRFADHSVAQLKDIRLHVLYHSVASFAGGRGNSLVLIGNFLSHRDQRSTATYADLAGDIRPTLADDVSVRIRDAMAVYRNVRLLVPIVTLTHTKRPKAREQMTPK